MGEKANKKFLLENLKGTDQSKDLGIEGVIILKLIFVLSTSCFKISFQSVFQNNICW
jgi:hypothetical protein